MGSPWLAECDVDASWFEDSSGDDWLCGSSELEWAAGCSEVSFAATLSPLASG